MSLLLRYSSTSVSGHGSRSGHSISTSKQPVETAPALLGIAQSVGTTRLHRSSRSAKPFVPRSTCGERNLAASLYAQMIAFFSFLLKWTSSVVAPSVQSSPSLQMTSHPSISTAHSSSSFVNLWSSTVGSSRRNYMVSWDYKPKIFVHSFFLDFVLFPEIGHSSFALLRERLSKRAFSVVG